jgi:DNA mismatch repair ATPase MutS
MNGSKAVNYTMGENYTLQMGISKIKGGIKVLEAQAFPIKIIERAKELVS